MRSASRLSLRSQLLLGILLPLFVLVAVNAAILYGEALESADTAYDRTLLATAKSIGELLEVRGSGDQARLASNVPYSALEAFEADNRSRLFYKVTGFSGEMVSGFEDLPRWTGTIPQKGIYAALVDFYDAHYRGVPVRVAVLLQPVAGIEGRGMATIQVAETLELRQTLARQMLLGTLWRQAALLAVIALVVVAVVQRATRPVRELSDALRGRSAEDLAPIDAGGAPRELQPLVDATNQVMARLAHLLAHQKRFVRDASHQLRTPLAVLKAQVQSAQRGDVDAASAIAEIGETVDGATRLANQMLALAKVEQLRQQADPLPVEWGSIVREVALDVSALIARRRLDFELEVAPVHVVAHDWSLRELTRNLLHNAIRYGPEGGALSVRLAAGDGEAVLTVRDSGPGLAPAARERLFQPFGASSGGGDDALGGSGLGLAICKEIVGSLHGTIALEDRRGPEGVAGLDAIVRLPLADNAR